jgi:hypothetical protein
MRCLTFCSLVVTLQLPPPWAAAVAGAREGVAREIDDAFAGQLEVELLDPETGEWAIC